MTNFTISTRLLSYGTYLLNEQLSKLPPIPSADHREGDFPIWPSVTDGITGMSGGAATLGRMLDFVNVPSIPYVFGAAVPVFALASNAQVVSIVGDGIAGMAGNGGDGRTTKGTSGAANEKSGENEADTKPSLKSAGNNKKANELVKEQGYKDAHDFKRSIVGKGNEAKFDIKIDSKSGEIYLENKDGSVQIPTGHYR